MESGRIVGGGQLAVTRAALNNTVMTLALPAFFGARSPGAGSTTDTGAAKGERITVVSQLLVLGSCGGNKTSRYAAAATSGDSNCK